MDFSGPARTILTWMSIGFLLLLGLAVEARGGPPENADDPAVDAPVRVRHPTSGISGRNTCGRIRAPGPPDTSAH